MNCEFSIDRISYAFCNLSVVGRIMVPKDVCVLIPRTCEYELYVTLQVADVIKFKDLKMNR